MTCTEIRKDLPDYVLGKMADPDREAIARHLAACTACRAEVEEMEAAFSALAKNQPWQPDASYWSTLLPRIHERIETKRRRLIPEWVLRALLPAAAALALVLLVGRVMQTGPRNGPQDLSTVLSQTPSEELQDFVDQNSIDGILEASDRATTADDQTVLKTLVVDEGGTFVDESDQESMLESVPEKDADAVASILEQRKRSEN